MEDELRQALAAMGENRRVLRTHDPRLVDFSHNDYLGLRTHPVVIERARAWTLRHGAGSGSSRLVSASHAEYLALERRLADFKGKEAALLFASGYQLNATVIPAIADLLGADLFFDKLAHASIYHGVKGLPARRFRHNDLDHLDSLLKASRARHKLILTESVFSMDGDRAPLEDLAALAERHGAHLYIDEAHAGGVLGPEGRGLCYPLGSRIAMVMGTLGKAMGGAGAYIAGSAALIAYLVNRAQGFVYSTALPPAALGALEGALDLLPGMEEARARVQDRAARLRRHLRARGFSCGPSTSQIVPLILGAAAAALAAQAHLARHGLHAVAIRPPTVPPGKARLRLSMSAGHSEPDFALLCETLAAL
ncbi:MAG TPA: 8-amino-7-oxononanoate synthase [Dongiaceae bacterium]|jgi:8-amino-7-oxononanoate synthase|nr:8-amino-7-oxononanoate synthase [Dongiaceae bacterium]